MRQIKAEVNSAYGQRDLKHIHEITRKDHNQEKQPSLCTKRRRDEEHANTGHNGTIAITDIQTKTNSGRRTILEQLAETTTLELNLVLHDRNLVLNSNATQNYKFVIDPRYTNNQQATTKQSRGFNDYLKLECAVDGGHRKSPRLLLMLLIA